MQTNTNANINTLFERLENFLKTKTVVGESFKVGETTLIPIINLSFALGSGGGEGDAKGMNGNGEGAGIGAKVTPTAMLVIKGDSVEMLPIKKSSNLEKLIEMVPEIIEKLPNGCCGSKKENESKETKED